MKIPTPGLINQILELCQQKRKIDAIKLYMDTTQSTLKKSKECVEKLCKQHNIKF